MLRLGDTGPAPAEIAIASAATTDLGSIKSLLVLITGATTITSLGTAPNRIAYLRFAGSLTLTHNATSLILPGAASIATAAGDHAICTSDASGNWTCRHYQRANGLPLGVGRGQLLRAVSSTLPGGLAAFLDAGLVSASPDDPSNLAYHHEPFAMPGGVLAGLLTTYCQTSLGMTESAAAAQVAALFALAATLTPGT